MAEATYLRTPYFQTRIPSRTGGCLQQPQTNYYPYNLFALRTRLEPLAKKRLGLAIFIHFNSRYLDEKILVTVEFWQAGQPLILNPADKNHLQRALNHIVANEPDLVLLMSEGSQWPLDLTELSQGERKLLPSWWTRDVAPYLSFTPHLRPHYRPAREFQIPGLYLDLSRLDSHASFFKEIYKDAMNRLNEMFNQGYLSLPVSFDTEQLSRWQVASLRSITRDDAHSLVKTLFYPEWEDLRLTRPVGGMAAFLVKHLVRGSNRVWLKVGRGLLVRHQIAATFQRRFTVNQYRFFNDIVEVEANNLEEAQAAASLVELAQSLPVGKIVLFQFPSRDWFNLYLILLHQMTEAEKIRAGLRELRVLGYRVVTANASFCLSGHIPYHANGLYYQTMIRRYVKSQVTRIPELLVSITEEQKPEVRVQQLVGPQRPVIEVAKIKSLAKVPPIKGELVKERPLVSEVEKRPLISEREKPPLLSELPSQLLSQMIGGPLIPSMFTQPLMA